MWIRGNAKPTFSKTTAWLVLGIRGSGKSSFLERIGTEYLKKGCCVFDLFGSRDGEGLAWLRSPYARGRKILLLKGDSVKVEYRGKYRVDIKSYSRFTLLDVEYYDIIISSSPLYSSIDEEFNAIGYVVEELFKRFSWERVVYLLVREAGQLLYSRLKLIKSQKDAKTNFIYLLREARHMGIALGLDTLKFTSIESDVRWLADYIVIKQLGAFSLPPDLSWLYTIFDPSALQQIPPQYFIIISSGGAVGTGWFAEVSWHKKEGEDILSRVKLIVKN